MLSWKTRMSCLSRIHRIRSNVFWYSQQPILGIGIYELKKEIIEEKWNMVPQNGATCPEQTLLRKSSTRIICFWHSICMDSGWICWQTKFVQAVVGGSGVIKSRPMRFRTSWCNCSTAITSESVNFCAKTGGVLERNGYEVRLLIRSIRDFLVL